ncbi:MAG: hypothetical protein GTO17_02830 [Candidatus Aminicenantes bacterium]|nr:hypothetical protein [Candidatus Aminicenantes bacterium]
MRVLKVMILGLIILCHFYLAPPSVTKTSGDDSVSTWNKSLAEAAAEAGFDSPMPQARPYPGNPNHYFLVYSRENYSGDARRVYVETENTHPLSFWDTDAIRLIDKYTGYPPMSHFVRNVPIKSIKLRVFVHVTLFEGENFTGYCTRITKDLPSLRGTLLRDIKSLSVNRNCPQNRSTRRFNVFINNDSVFRIRYKLKINGRWEPTPTIVRKKKSETRGVDSDQIVSIQIEFLDAFVWKSLCSYDLDWTRNNYITVKSTGLHKIWCEKQ